MNGLGDIALDSWNSSKINSHSHYMEVAFITCGYYIRWDFAQSVHHELGNLLKYGFFILLHVDEEHGCFNFKL